MVKKIFGTLLSSLLFIVFDLSAQELNGLAGSTEICPKISVLLTENEQTRLIYFKLKSGQKCPMHRTTGGFAYVITGGTITLITADGNKTPISFKDGQTISYGEAEHAVEGTRGTFEAIFLENKTAR